MAETFRRIGLIVPGTDEVSEVDYHLYLPRGVVLHTARLFQEPDAKMGTKENIDNLIGSLADACRSVALAKPEILVFSCTNASFFHGRGWDMEVSKRMQAAAGIPAVTTSTAVCEALLASGAGRVYMVSPYPPHLHEIARRFFRDYGIDIADEFTFALKESRECGSLTPSAIKEAVIARKDDIGTCDVVLLSGTGVRAMEVADEIERALDVPVVTSNTATMWAALTRIGVDAGGVRAGRLFGLAPVVSETRAA